MMRRLFIAILVAVAVLVALTVDEAESQPRRSRAIVARRAPAMRANRPNRPAPTRQIVRPRPRPSAASITATTTSTTTTTSPAHSGETVWLPAPPAGPDHAVEARWPCGSAHPYAIDPNRLTPRLEAMVHETFTELERSTGHSFPFAGVGADAQIQVKFATRAEEPTRLPDDGRAGSAWGDPTPRTVAWAVMIPRDSDFLDRSIVVHELGHVAGLGHVDDRAQAMHPDARHVTYRGGDRTGLRTVGCS